MYTNRFKENGLMWKTSLRINRIFPMFAIVGAKKLIDALE